MLIVITQKVIILSVILQSVIILSVIKQSAIMLRVIMLSAVVSFCQTTKITFIERKELHSARG
jgi:hypothetical protein